jgi:hypothetical protein
MSSLVGSVAGVVGLQRGFICQLSSRVAVEAKSRVLLGCIAQYPLHAPETPVRHTLDCAIPSSNLEMS